jgi:hypothetical protein
VHLDGYGSKGYGGDYYGRRRLTFNKGEEWKKPKVEVVYVKHRPQYCEWVSVCVMFGVCVKDVEMVCCVVRSGGRGPLKASCSGDGI